MMGIIRRLVAKMNDQSKKRCAICATRLHEEKGMTGLFTSSQMMSLLETMSNKAIQCDRCNIHFCLQCSVRFAKSRGLGDYICPRCGEKVTPAF